MNGMKYFLTAALACFTTLALAQTPTAKLDSGVIEGSVHDGVASFKGVPFAAPPVGPLRWRAPQPVAAWSTPRQTTAYAADCMQVPFPSDAAPLGTAPAEDCLYANVWLPAKKPAAKLPVMVWIYGGGSVNGGSSPDVYSGEHFASLGLVFISFNYRVGRFGYFAHPALSAENADGLLGNYGYMDQLAALRWVQRNAAAFGGDASNVTVFGESAGGGSVHMLLGTPLSNGLFERAIIQSAGGRGFGRADISGATPGGVPSAEATGLKFANSVGVEGSGKDALAKLRALPAEAIRGNLNMATMRENFYTGPMVDGKIVLGSQADAYLAGTSQKVPIIVGANSADAGNATASSLDALFAPYGTDREQARAAYTAGGQKDLAVLRGEVGRDRGMLEPARFVVRTYAARGIPTYEYRFSYVANSMRDTWKTGVPHATELPFVFDTVRAKYGDATTASDEKMGSQAMQYWANFAKNGDPNGPGLPNWPRYETASDTIMNFTEKGPMSEPDPWKARLDVNFIFNSSTPVSTVQSTR